MKIALLGDIALIGRFDLMQTKNGCERLKAVKEAIKDCDFVVGNLETPLTNIRKTYTCKGVYLRSDPKNVEVLKCLGITHVTLANNHTFDYGKSGAEETCKILEQAGIRYIGLNGGAEMLSDGKEKALLEGFCCLSANALGYGTTQGRVNLMSPERVEHFLKSAENQNAIPIVSAHFGVEGVHFPSIEHLGLFRKLAGQYTYILHGNHPHAIQGYEKRDNSLLIYAQGNLCFDEVTTTSIHSIPGEKAEELKCYLSIIELVGGKIKSHKTIAFEDCREKGLCNSTKVQAELEQYCNDLELPLSEIALKRAEELKQQRAGAEARNLSFFAKRLNYRYIGAYLNGKKHAKEYEKVFKNYIY